MHFKDECLKEGMYKAANLLLAVIEVLFITAEELDDECIEDEQCKPLLASCTEAGKCGCTDEQHEKNGICETKRRELKFTIYTF